MSKLTTTDNSEFDHWLLTAKSSVPNNPYGKHNLPLATELLYGICNNDDDKFLRLCDILEECFKAGQLKGER
jgi:hypothetical protein